MASRFRVSSVHPEDLACGLVLAPGEVSSRVKPSDPHDKRLIEKGRLVELPAKRSVPPKENEKEEVPK
jgi:hypothetical protein